jgi:hypothetical protein
MPADRFFHPRAGHSRKVTALSDLEFRVWWTYELAADDYGVMRRSPVVLQAANDALGQRSRTQVERALDRVVEVGLLVPFEHQGEGFVCQLTWQNFQKVKYPREAINPLPPPEIVAQCSEATQELFAFHSQNVPGTLQTLAGAGGRERLTANGNGTGNRLTANGLSERFAEFWAVYPKKIGKDAAWRVWQKRRPSQELTADILAALERQHDWLLREEGRFIPNPATWLNQGRWQDEPPAVPERAITPAELREAKQQRQAIGRCPHDPPCQNFNACVREIVRKWRHDRGETP